MAILMVITFGNISVMAFVQGVVPGHMLGKIIALIVTVVNFASPVGSMGFGIVLEYTVGARWLMFALLAVLTMGIAWGAKRVLGRYEITVK